MGRLEVVEWLPIHAPASAGNGHSQVVKCLHGNREEGCTTITMSNAARNGHFEVVKWLHSNRREVRESYVLHDASGRSYMVQWLHEQQIIPPAEGLFTIARAFELVLSTWFQLQRGVLKPHLCCTSRLEIVQYLLERAPEICQLSTLRFTASNENL